MRISLKKLLKIVFLLFTVLIICILVNFKLDGDENFTMGLIHNGYGNIINLDSLDVHPPLYYFLLKFFLQITTFWTSNIFIKVFFARLFSLITGITFICIGLKLLKFMYIKNNKDSIIILILSIPSILLYFQYIRMYMLAAMFLIIELYELIKYVKYNKAYNLILATIIGSLAAYTHYFAAISAGLFLFYFFIKFIYNKNFIKSIKIGISGIIYLILYIPWIFIAKKQFSMATSSQYNTNQIYTKYTYTATNLVNLIKQSLLSLVGGQGTYGNELIKIISVLLLILFAYLIYWSFKHLDHKFNSLLIISVVNLIGTILIGIIVSLIKHPILIDHYLFPSFAIFAFFMSYVICKYIKTMFNNRAHICMSWLLILLLFMNVALYAGHSAKNLIRSHAIITEMNVWNYSKHRNIYMKNTKKNIWNIADDSIYLRSLHKNVKTNDFKNTDLMFGRPNMKLMHGVYPNVKKN